MMDGTVVRVSVAAWVLCVAVGAGEPSDAMVAPGPTSVVDAAVAPREGGEDAVASTGSAGRAAGGVARFGGLGGSLTNQTVITSRQLLYDYRRSIAMFEGKVVVTDPQIRITSDRLIVVFGVSNEVQSVTALDDVKIYNADREGSCERAVYKVPASEIMLSGSPVLRRGRDVLKGDRITFWTDREVVVCEPGELILTPESAKVKP